MVMPCTGFERFIGELDGCVPTDCPACAVTAGRPEFGSPAGGALIAGGGGAAPCGGGAGPAPGSPEPAGGPLLTCAAGAPAVVPIALIWASVIRAGGVGAAGAAVGGWLNAIAAPYLREDRGNMPKVG